MIGLICEAQTQVMDRLEIYIATIVGHQSEERTARLNLEGTLRHQLNFSDRDIATVRAQLTIARLHAGNFLAPSLAADLIIKDLTFQCFKEACDCKAP